MEQNILLTYEHIDGYSTYGWFENIEYVNHFIQNASEIKNIIECIDCSNCKQINLSELESL